MRQSIMDEFSHCISLVSPSYPHFPNNHGTGLLALCASYYLHETRLVAYTPLETNDKHSVPSSCHRLMPSPLPPIYYYDQIYTHVRGLIDCRHTCLMTYGKSFMPFIIVYDHHCLPSYRISGTPTAILVHPGCLCAQCDAGTASWCQQQTATEARLFVYERPCLYGALQPGCSHTLTIHCGHVFADH